MRNTLSVYSSLLRGESDQLTILMMVSTHALTKISVNADTMKERGKRVRTSKLPCTSELVCELNVSLALTKNNYRLCFHERPFGT